MCLGEGEAKTKKVPNHLYLPFSFLETEANKKVPLDRCKYDSMRIRIESSSKQQRFDSQPRRIDFDINDFFYSLNFLFIKIYFILKPLVCWCYRKIQISISIVDVPRSTVVRKKALSDETKWKGGGRLLVINNIH